MIDQNPLAYHVAKKELLGASELCCEEEAWWIEVPDKLCLERSRCHKNHKKTIFVCERNNVFHELKFFLALLWDGTYRDNLLYWHNKNGYLSNRYSIFYTGIKKE